MAGRREQGGGMGSPEGGPAKGPIKMYIKYKSNILK